MQPPVLLPFSGPAPVIILPLRVQHWCVNCNVAGHGGLQEPDVVLPMFTDSDGEESEAGQASPELCELALLRATVQGQQDWSAGG